MKTTAFILTMFHGSGDPVVLLHGHPEKVRKVVSISAVFRHGGWVKEA